MKQQCYSAIPVTSRRGAQIRRWIEICEVGPRGGVLRIVARTPVIVGISPDAARRLERAAEEATFIAVALKKSSLSRQGAVEAADTIARLAP